MVWTSACSLILQPFNETDGGSAGSGTYILFMFRAGTVTGPVICPLAIALAAQHGRPEPACRALGPLVDLRIPGLRQDFRSGRWDRHLPIAEPDYRNPRHQPVLRH